MKLASFDIFDTTLIRRCGKPENIFYLMAERLYPNDKVAQDGFVEWRKKRPMVVSSMRNEKLGMRNVEVGLEEIYERLQVTEYRSQIITPSALQARPPKTGGQCEASSVHKLNIRSVVEEVIERTGLTVEANKKIGQLSKGYRQRVGIAAAIIHNPRVLILDEPTTGLDPNQLIEIRQLIKDLGRERLVIFSTHIMQEVEQVCDDVIIINRGNVIEQGEKNELVAKYGSIERIFYSMRNGE